MKRILSLSLALLSATAMALPSPKQVESALENGNCAQARNYVNEILVSRPDSARAHLLNAATIMCLERDPNLAQRELDAVRAYDHKGDVLGSRLFAKMERDIAGARQPVVQAYVPPPPPVVVQAAPQVQAQPVAVTKPADEGSSFGSKFLVLLFLFTLGGLGYYWYRRTKSEDGGVDFSSPVTATATSAPSSVTTASSGMGTTRSTYSTPPAPSPAAWSRPSRTYTAPPAPTYVPPTVVHTGPSALETGVAVAGGVVAGNMISDALRHRHDDDTVTRRRREESSGTSDYSSSASTYTPPVITAPAPTFSSSAKDDAEWGGTSEFSSSSAPEPAPAPAPYYAPAPAPSYSSSRDDDDSSSRSSSWSSSSSDSGSSWGSSDSGSSSSSDSGSSDW